MKTKQTFKEHLRKSNLSENTITSYLWTVNYFHSHYDEVNKENLLAYKGYLMEFFKPKTVNLRIQGINKYLEFLGKEKLQLKAVKVQQKNFLENIISNADYNYLKKQLKKDGNMESGKGSVLLSRYQHINPVWFSNALTHPHDKSGGFQFIQRTLDRHGTAGQDCGNGCNREADKQDSVFVLLPFG